MVGSVQILQRSLLRKKGEMNLAGKVKTICEEKVAPIIENLGYEVVEIEYAKKSDGMNLTFFIDKENGIQIEDCEKVSKAIDGILEELNPTDNQPYILSVSSPGIDRPIKTDRDFERNKGKEIEITLFSKIEGKKKFVGKLLEYSENEIVIDNGKNISISRDKIAHAVPVIKF